ncbi:hypothetical protein D3C86_1480330 [compost metagenome]
MVNSTANSFQISESVNGAIVKVTDTGTAGFNVSRFNYGRCFISDVVVERDWRNDNALSPNFQLLLTGAVLRNITVKNYEIDVRSPANYVGRPNVIDGITLIEGGANFESVNVMNGTFMRAKTGILGGDIALGSNDARYKRKISFENCLFQNVGVNYNGNVTNHRSTLLNVSIGKTDSTNIAIITNSYMENTKINLRWLTYVNSVTIAGCTFNNVISDINANTRLLNNITL